MLSIQIKVLRKSYFFTFLFFLSSYSHTVYSQNREGYELLWEIEHKDSTKKSYLFGTMHLKDKRLFDFSDAMLPAIKNSEAFALEVHPDSAMQGVMRSFSEKGMNDRIKKLLTDEEYKLLDEKYQNINGKPLDSIQINSFNMDSMFIPNIDKEDDMNTFLDGYIYAIAYSLDKEIYGLEKLEDQMPTPETISDTDLRNSILENLYTTDEEYLEYLEEMIDIYAKGNLSALQVYMDRDSISPSMVRRNRIMVNSMVEIIKNKSLFAAVGAAHLPGENGMITMLRNEGFTVTKVDSEFTGKSNNFEFKPNLNRWYNDRDESKGYSVHLPTKSMPHKVEENFEVLTSIDITSGITFVYFARNLEKNMTNEETNKIIENYISYYSENQQSDIVDVKPFEKNTLFKEVILKNENRFQKIVLGVTNTIFYGFLSEYGNTPQETEYTNAFFDSIEIFPPLKTSTEWTTSVNEEAGYSIQFPNQKFRQQTNEIKNPLNEDGDPYIIHLFLSRNEEDNTNYLFRYNDQPTGYYIESTSDIIKEFENYFKTSGTLLNGPESYVVNDINFTEYEAKLLDSSHVLARLYLRGNRIYFLMAQKTDLDEKADRNNPFFNSFQYLEYSKIQTLENKLNIDDRYSIMFPGKYKVETDSVSFEDTEFLKNTRYYTKNPVTGGAYIIEHVKLKPYFSVQNLDSIYSRYTENLTNYNDTIIFEKKVTINSLPAKEILYKNKENENYHLMQIILDNDNYFIFNVYDSKKAIDQGLPRLFFQSFQKKFDKNYFQLFESKTKNILKDIHHKDTLIANAAREAFYYYNFQKEDIPLLVKELNKSFDDDKEYLGVKNKIIASLGILDDESIVPVLRKHYHNKKTSNAQKITILETLPKMSGAEAMDTYTDLLFNETPTPIEHENFDVFKGMQNKNFKYTVHSEKIKELLNNTDYREGLLEYANNISWNDSAAIKLFKETNTNWFTHFKRDTEVYVDSIKRNNNTYATYFLISNYLNLLETLKQNDLQIKHGLVTLTEQLPTNNWLHTRALVASIHVGVEINPVVLSRSLDTLYSRFEIMEALVTNNQRDQIPESYLEGLEFSKLSIFNHIGDYYDQANNIQLLGKLEHEDKSYYVFDFFISEEENEDEERIKYIAIVEDKPVDFSEFYQNNVYFEWESVEEDWEAQATTILKNRYFYYYD